METAANVRAEVESMQGVRKVGADQMVLIRFFKNRSYGSKQLVEEENLPRVVRDLVRTLADMIDHDFEFFFGSLVFLELALFPHSSLCKRANIAVAWNT